MTAWRLHCGDARALLAQLPDASVDAVICDPPYGLASTPPRARDVLEAWLDGREAVTSGAGFMGARWDRFVPGPSVWREVHRVLRPGGFAAAFAAARTYHWTAIAAELAELEVRDLAEWLYGTGKPSGRRVVDAEGRVRHSGLKPAHEPILIARRPLEGTLDAGVLDYGLGAFCIDAARVPMPGESYSGKREGPRADGVAYNLARAPMRSSHERTNHPLGRWPANVLHDGSAFEDALVEHGAPEDVLRFWYNAKASRTERERGLEALGDWRGTIDDGRRAVADNAFQRGRTRRRNVHPTVKPVRLLRYLVRLLSPPGSLVLDPFVGSGTTGIACVLEGRRFVGAELRTDHAAIAALRIAHAEENPDHWADTDTRSHYAETSARSAACARAREASPTPDRGHAADGQSTPTQLGLL